jgi:hypothetical protein
MNDRIDSFRNRSAQMGPALMTNAQSTHLESIRERKWRRKHERFGGFFKYNFQQQGRGENHYSYHTVTRRKNTRNKMIKMRIIFLLHQYNRSKFNDRYNSKKSQDM